ncbi:MAG TPA: hypothetical protein VKE26_23685 [Xanthobacteraceae bacterium]|nr:hypothetical protein [Xanthobacteraceae bacterium]
MVVRFDGAEETQVQRASRIALIVTGFIPLAGMAGTGWGQHQPDPSRLETVSQPAQGGPTSVTIVFENDAIRVLRIRMEPHEKTPMHEITARLVVWLTDAHLRDTAPDGSSHEIHRRAGAVEWTPTRRHAGENLGDHPIEFLGILPQPNRPAR